MSHRDVTGHPTSGLLAPGHEGLDTFDRLAVLDHPTLELDLRAANGVQHPLDGGPGVGHRPFRVEPCNRRRAEGLDPISKAPIGVADEDRTGPLRLLLAVDRPFELGQRRLRGAGTGGHGGRAVGAEVVEDVERLLRRVRFGGLASLLRDAGGFGLGLRRLSRTVADDRGLKAATDGAEPSQVCASAVLQEPAAGEGTVPGVGERAVVHALNERRELRVRGSEVPFRIEASTLRSGLALGLGGLLLPIVAHRGVEHGLGLADPVHVAMRDVLFEPAPGVLAAPGLDEEGIGRLADDGEERIASVLQLPPLLLRGFGGLAGFGGLTGLLGAGGFGLGLGFRGGLALGRESGEAGLLELRLVRGLVEGLLREISRHAAVPPLHPGGVHAEDGDDDVVAAVVGAPGTTHVAVGTEGKGVFDTGGTGGEVCGVAGH